MRRLSRLVISAAILALATSPVLAGSLPSSVHGGANVSTQSVTHAGVVFGGGHGGFAPLARKMGPKGCYRNCMRGGMREDFCTLSCF